MARRTDTAGDAVAPVAAGVPAARPREIAALVAVWAAPVAALVWQTRLTRLPSSFWLLYSPLGAATGLVALGVVVGAVWLFHDLLRPRSTLRRWRGGVPARYPVLAWAWVAALLVPLPLEPWQRSQGPGTWSHHLWITDRLGTGPVSERVSQGAVVVIAVLGLAAVAIPVAVAVLRRRDLRDAIGPGWRAVVGGRLSARDRAALAAVAVAPVLGFTAKAMVPGYLLFFVVIQSLPVTVPVLAISAWALYRPLGSRSPVRSPSGAVPGRYHRAAWLWAVAVFLPGLVLPDGGELGEDLGRPYHSAVTVLLGIDGLPQAFVTLALILTAACVAVAVICPIVVTTWLRRDRRVAGPPAARHHGAMRIEAVQGDITAEAVDAIVNAANSSLLGGGGVDGAIHAAAGPELLAQCRELRRTAWPDGLPVGEAAATGAGALPARWVIHTVGPNRHAGQVDPELLASCFRRSLDVAAGLGARSVAFPAVSGGVYGWAMADVARVAVAAVTGWADERGSEASVELVRFVLFDADALERFRHELGA